MLAIWYLAWYFYEITPSYFSSYLRISGTKRIFVWSLFPLTTVCPDDGGSSGQVGEFHSPVAIMGRILSCNTDTGNLSADAVHKHDTAQAKHKKIGKNVYRPQCHDIFTQSKNRENGNSVVGGVSRNDIIDLLTYGYISQTKDVIAETSISTVIKGEIDMKLISGLHPRLRKAVSFAKHNKVRYPRRCPPGRDPIKKAARGY